MNGHEEKQGIESCRPIKRREARKNAITSKTLLS